eukprot:g6255.t1
MSMVVPSPRNAVDRQLPQWSGGKWWPFQSNCKNRSHTWNPQIPSGCVPEGTDGWGCNCANGSQPCDVGQSCFWFSQGCTIGCDKCDGGGSNPNTRDRCGSGMNATVCDPLHRTYNRDAECNTAADEYRYNPWRAPGNAPVYDPCGMAGGGPQEQGGEAKYTTTKFAKQGDLGSKVLPALPTGTVWRRGSIATTKWSIRANHGGGYQYRLCKADRALTEACFQETPLPFATGVHMLEWADSPNATLNVAPGSLYINATHVPAADGKSTWAMNPLPQSDTGRCSGRDPFNTLIVDALTVPVSLEPGAYVLGLRWDCEKSAQM